MTRDDAALQRLIPLPHEIAIAGWHDTPRNSVGVRVAGPDMDSKQIAAAMRVLEQAGIGSRRGTPNGLGLTVFLASCDRVAAPAAALAEHLDRTLGRVATLPNHDQAYGIVPVHEEGVFCGLVLAACTTVGVLYAARTLAQLLGPPAESAETIAVPEVTITDWPDIEERGQWGGNTHDELEWNAAWKLNLIEESAGITVDSAGASGMRLTREYLGQAHAAGTRVVPYIPHLEQVARTSNILDRVDITSTPDPDSPLPREYIPGLCMSSPATVELVAEWMGLIAALPHVQAIEVWLSEDRSPCYCPRCRGKEPFGLEMACIREAFERVRSDYPDLSLRVLLTQGSYPVNDRVIAAAGPEVQITYYDGGRTYDSSHAPMIYPLLEEYARSGRWLGVYPQITHCWRTVFPFTAPQLIRTRAQEFAGKGLRNVVGYAVPSNRHHEANVMALAEWSWNPAGRTVEEFARAYACASGICDPDLYAEWVTEAGEAGWWLAESRLLLRAIYSSEPAIGADEQQVADHRFRRSTIVLDRPRIVEALGRAVRARYLARHSGVADLVDESEAVHAGLTALLCLDVLLSPDSARHHAERALEIFDRAAAVLCLRVSSWGQRVNRSMHTTRPYTNPMRMRDTANALLRLGDALRRHPRLRGYPDPYGRHRLRRIGGWRTADFTSGDEVALGFDLSGLLAPSVDTCYVSFSYGRGNHAAAVRRVALVEHGPGDASRVLAETVDAPSSVGRWEAWHEFRLDVPRARAGTRRLAEVTLSAVRPAGDRVKEFECSGEIGLRVGWPGLWKPDTPVLEDSEI